MSSSEEESEPEDDDESFLAGAFLAGADFFAGAFLFFSDDEDDSLELLDSTLAFLTGTFCFSSTFLALFLADPLLAALFALALETALGLFAKTFFLSASDEELLLSELLLSRFLLISFVAFLAASFFDLLLA